MKHWQSTLIGLFAGVILLAAIVLAAAGPRGTAVELLPGPTPGPVVVHVTGAVKQPGVYELMRGSRLEDAIEAAGGLTGEADTEAINLAARLKDGDRVRIPVQGETPPLKVEQPAGADESVGEPVNLNTATLDQLQTLPGIGEKKAEDILAYREMNGGFKTIEEIQEVPGIGPAMYEKLQHLITVE